MDRKWIVYIGVAIFFVASMAVAVIQHNQCIQDGYNRTQCWMLITAQNTTNHNIFGAKQ